MSKRKLVIGHILCLALIVIVDVCLAEKMVTWDSGKGGSGRMEMDANLDKVRGVHPRIYLNSERIEQLREAINTTHASLWLK